MVVGGNRRDGHWRSENDGSLSRGRSRTCHGGDSEHGRILHQVAARLGATFAVVGSYQTNADRIRITARIVNVESGEARADAKVDGPIAEIFELQDQVVAQFSKELGLGAAPASRDSAARETPSLEAYRAYTEAWLHLEALDVREIPQAIADFQRAITIDPGYALAFTGLASAQLAAYEATRADTTPASQLLNDALGHARRRSRWMPRLPKRTPRSHSCWSAPGRRPRLCR